MMVHSIMMIGMVLYLDLDSIKTRNEEPIRLQIARYVYGAVQNSRLKECDMSSNNFSTDVKCLDSQ